MKTTEFISKLKEAGRLSEEDVKAITPYDFERINSFAEEKQKEIKNDVKDFLIFKETKTSNIDVFEMYKIVHRQNISDELLKNVVENTIESTIEEEHRVINERIKLRKEFIEMLKIYEL